VEFNTFCVVLQVKRSKL